MSDKNITPQGEETKAPGRPVNENSARQQRIKDLEKRRQEGTLKLGRPVVEGSKRQKQEQERLEREASGIKAKRGRPKFTAEQKEKAEKEKAARKEQEKQMLLEKVKATVITPETMETVKDESDSGTPVVEAETIVMEVAKEEMEEAGSEPTGTAEVEVTPTDITLTASVPAEEGTKKKPNTKRKSAQAPDTSAE